MLPHFEFRRAHQVTHVFDKQKVQRGKIQPRQGRCHHGRIQVTFPAEAIARIQQGNLCPITTQPISIQRGFNIPLNHAGSYSRSLRRCQHVLQHCGLTRAGGAHYVDGLHVMCIESVPIVCGTVIILRKNIL